MSSRESHLSPNKTREGEYELVVTVDGTIDPIQAEAEAYSKAPATYLGRPRKPGAELRWQNRSVSEWTFTYGFFDEDEDEEPQGELPTLATLEIKGGGQTFHTNQCLSQVAYPAGKGQGVVDCKAVGLHRDGVHGVDIHVPGSVYTITCKWLPAAIKGSYIDGLDDLQGKTNKQAYTIQWGFNKIRYSLECEAGELLFTDYDCKTTKTRSGIGVWEFSYSMLRIKNRTNIDLGKNVNGTSISVTNKRGHEYLWVWYRRKEIANPSVFIEVPEMAFVSKLYEEADFKAKMGF